MPECPGVGLPVFLDWAGGSNTIPRCGVCGKVIRADINLNATTHEAPPPEVPL